MNKFFKKTHALEIVCKEFLTLSRKLFTKIISGKSEGVMKKIKWKT